jgi:hypothetical protein
MAQCLREAIFVSLHPSGEQRLISYTPILHVPREIEPVRTGHAGFASVNSRALFFGLEKTMETVLKVIGAIWTLIGLRDLLALFWTDSSQGVLDFGFMFNLLLFVLPGLVVYGIGARMKKKQLASTEVATNNPSVASSETSVGEQLGNLDSRKNKDLFSTPELESRRAEILKEV